MKIKIILTILTFVITVNAFKLSRELSLTAQLRRHLPFYFQGLQFTELKNILKEEKTIGYYTDKNWDSTSQAAQFSRAQYVLAPLILDLNYARQNFILLDCSSEKKALEKIKELGAVPLRKNNFGVILARAKPNLK